MNEKEGGFVISKLRLRWNDPNHFLDVEARRHGIREKGVKQKQLQKKSIINFHLFIEENNNRVYG